MSYLGISIREALDKINAPNCGWVLPEVQRQYVWGVRNDSETYVCLLLDSLIRRYPIGGIVLWETNEKIPYRKFAGDYDPKSFPKLADKGLWGTSKCLVYDGQQRLQTLYSVLRHTYNDKILYFDVLFDESKADPDDSGFSFKSADKTCEGRYLRMTEIANLKCDQKVKVALEQRVLKGIGSDERQELLIRQNIGSLWEIFVDTNIKSIAYFSVRSNSSNELNEIFRRLNIGGVALTQIELVVSKIKAQKHDYEEKLWKLHDQIEKESGINFPSSAIFQFFHLMVKNTVRIDEKRIENSEIHELIDAAEIHKDGLVELFKCYLNGLFNINHASIIRSYTAIYPIAAFISERKAMKQKWRIREMPELEMRLINQYFLLSQYCEWDTQTMINEFTKLATEAAKRGEAFPLAAIRKFAMSKNRVGRISVDLLEWLPLFSSKILMPSRKYMFHEQKPHIDHIFPMKLEGKDDEYRRLVNVLWNYQPMPAEVNNYKRNRHPKEFFNSGDGRKYWDSYDFIPRQNSELWENPNIFVKYRKKLMLSKLEELYGLKC